MKSYKNKNNNKKKTETLFPGSVQKSFEGQVGKVEKQMLERPDKDVLGLYAKKKVVSRGLDGLDYAPAEESYFKNSTREELIGECIRLQTVIFNCAVDLGIARKTQSSELRFFPDFVSRVILTIKVGWAQRL